MHRVALFTLLGTGLLLAGTLQAQRGGGMRSGGGAHVAAGARAGARNGFAGRETAPGHTRNFGRNGHGYPYSGYPYAGYPYGGYDGPGYVNLGEDEPTQASQEAEPPPPGLMPPPMQRGRARIPSGAKVVEIPESANAAAPKPLPPAIFILQSGERIESQQYLLTCDHLELTADHQPRTIPLVRLDVKATLAADRQRGIDLRIPAGRGEISLGF